MQFNQQVIDALTGCTIKQITGEAIILDNGQPLYFNDSEIEALNSLWNPEYYTETGKVN